MASAGKGPVERTVDGHRIRLTNLDKVLYPETGTTKGEVIDYYTRVADTLIAHARNRPATRKRWVNGVGTPADPGSFFFQKDLDDSTPDWVARARIQHRDHANEYPLVNDHATVLWLAQIATLEIHTPQWRFDEDGTPSHPDRMVLDLDPGEGAGLAECVEVAKLARAALRDLGLDPIPVTSGSKGIHLYARLDGTADSDRVSALAHELARALEAEAPDLVVSQMKKAVRGGKVFVDWSQNNGSKTTVTPYSLRGRFRPTVAAPRTWRELTSPKLAQLEYPEILRRLARRGDPLADAKTGAIPAAGGAKGAASGRSAEPADSRDRTRGGATGQPVTDRLATYRSKRDASRTPEPVPASGAARGRKKKDGGRSFVIQEHHARSLHYDFRLEHDGVLVSWALPKGTPRTPKENHLAVQTEDHPLDYGGFEGTIPSGEYGAGEVKIWDHGDYDLEKWRDDEIIVTLHGAPDGGLGQARKFALIHTGGEGRSEHNWLIHLMAPSR